MKKEDLVKLVDGYLSGQAADDKEFKEELAYVLGRWDGTIRSNTNGTVTIYRRGHVVFESEDHVIMEADLTP